MYHRLPIPRAGSRRTASNIAPFVLSAWCFLSIPLFLFPDTGHAQFRGGRTGTNTGTHTGGHTGTTGTIGGGTLNTGPNTTTTTTTGNSNPPSENDRIRDAMHDRAAKYTGQIPWVKKSP
jgi:hypothetical protein